MKIIRLTAENVKKLTAVEINPDGSIITIGGKNGAGKSSVLDSIMYALGGAEAVPAEPIRKGERDAKVELDLGDIIVTRTFKRETLPCSCGQDQHTKDCDVNKLGPTKSTLTVRNKDGARYPSPQAMLDKLLGTLTFDPLDFKRAKPREQLETLRSITNIDTTAIDKEWKAAFDRRTDLNRQLKSAVAVLESLPVFDDVPAEEIPMSEISNQMAEAERLRREANDKLRAADKLLTRIHDKDTEISRLNNHIRDLELQLAQAKEDLAERQEAKRALEHEHSVAVNEAEAASKLVPNTEDLRKRITEIEETNQKVRANQKRAEQKERVASLTRAVEEETNIIKACAERKEQILSSVKFPVEGLGFGENGVLFNGVPFEQASNGEQLRVSVAIGLALNPKLKVLLIRQGESLDSDGMRLLADLAAEANAQLWVERMTEDKGTVMVMLEDGSIVQ